MSVLLERNASFGSFKTARCRRDERRFIVILIFSVIAYLIYLMGLTFLSPADFPANMHNGGRFPFLCDKPVDEDGYYMLTVAWQIAKGHGIVYNFHQPTAGIQPLAAFMFALAAYLVQLAGGDLWTFVRTILAIGGLNLLVFGHLVGTLSSLSVKREKTLAYVLGFLFVVFNFNLFRLFTYGLETGFYLTLFVLFVRRSVHMARQREPLSFRSAIQFGAFAGIVAWARIDFLVMLSFFFIAMLMSRQLRIKWVATSLAIAGVTLLPWLIYVHSISGGFIPSSGSAQSALISSSTWLPKLNAVAQALIGLFLPWIYSRPGSLPLWMTVALLLVSAIAVLHPKQVRAHIASMLAKSRVWICWSASGLALAIVYAALFSSVHFYHRYIAPLAVPVIGISVYAVIQRIAQMPHIHRGRIRIAVIILTPFCFFVWAFLSLHQGRIGNTHAVTAGFIRNHFPDMKVGAFQSGVIGYFNPNVVNLDGKINQQALNAQKAGTLAQYVDDEGIQVLVDWPEYIRREFKENWLRESWRPCDLAVPNDVSVCLVRKVLSAMRKPPQR